MKRITLKGFVSLFFFIFAVTFITLYQTVEIYALGLLFILTIIIAIAVASFAFALEEAFGIKERERKEKIRQKFHARNRKWYKYH